MKYKKKLISSGSPFEEQMAYSRAVVDGNWIFVSGTTGFDYKTMTIQDDIVMQTEHCFKNIEKVLKEAGAELKDVVRILYIVPQVEDFILCQPIIRKYLGEVKPAATMISAGLADSRMKIEIQVTAKK
ncbi:MAG: RidA family protein [Eudoraea sp.]